MLRVSRDGLEKQIPRSKELGAVLSLEKKGKLILRCENTLAGMLSIILYHVLVKAR